MADKRDFTPANTLNLIGKRFGNLKVVRRAGSTEKGNSLWLCKCDCGNEKVAMGTSLKRGDIVSCGCGRKEQIENAKYIMKTKHTIDSVQIPIITKKVRSDSSTGHKGVVKKIKNGNVRYEAYITVNKKRKYVGSSTDINKVINMRKAAEKKYFDNIINEYNRRMNNNEND